MSGKNYWKDFVIQLEMEFGLAYPNGDKSVTMTNDSGKTIVVPISTAFENLVMKVSQDVDGLYMRSSDLIKYDDFVLAEFDVRTPTLNDGTELTDENIAEMKPEDVEKDVNFVVTTVNFIDAIKVIVSRWDPDVEYEKMLPNKGQCARCLDVIESKHRHDFVSCECGLVSIDGGQDYQRVIGDIQALIPMDWDDTALNT